MFLFLLQTVALFCVVCELEYVGGAGVDRKQKLIFHGVEVEIHDFAYYAGLSNCGATILSDSWLVTAAHCVYPLPTFENYVWVGGASYHTSELVTYDDIVFYDHPINEEYANDIALIHLSEPLNFTDEIRPARLPSLKHFKRLHRNSKLVFVGRGIDESGDISTNLQKMDVRRLSTEECLSYMPREIQETIKPFASLLEMAILCAKRVGGGAGVCYGDSGSPLMHKDTLIGIASFIEAECADAQLGFYVNVVNYVPWIKSVTGIK